MMYEKNPKDKSVRETMRDLETQFSKKYLGDNGTEVAPLEHASEWLRDCIGFILSDERLDGARKEQTEREIFDAIRATEYGEEILKRIHVEEIQKSVEIRRDFESAFEKVKDTGALSETLSCALSDQDLKHLARLHKANKYREQINDLLVTCMFLDEYADFSSGNYAPYLGKEKQQIER
jgi:hypothetical protein